MGLNYKSDYSPELILNMMKDTSILISSDKEQNLVDFFVANVSSSITNKLTDEVEFWQWMSRNWNRSGIFDSPQNYNNYIVDAGKKFWAERQIQGKGYEWDWMHNERGKIKNILKQYNAGDISNRPGSDVTVHDFLTGKTEEYQMKAYTSGNAPVLDNTDASIKVVTNSENIDTIQQNGYEVSSFQNNEGIAKTSNKRSNSMRKLYAKGRTEKGSIVTNAKGSSYSSMHQWGVAFDFYRNDGKGAYNNEDNFFNKVGKIGRELGLEWGGDWKSIVDLPHFQLPDWGSGASKLKAKYKTPETFFKTWEDNAMTAEERQKFDTLVEQVKKLTLAQEKVYHYTKELPDWARPTIQKLLDKSIYAGASESDLNLPETLMRVLVINDRAGLYK